ncbi:MAG: hypothetical protein Q8L66_02130 [Caulobacter sp.]|nr:hypothetical protein [Caulobacter sp.]
MADIGHKLRIKYGLKINPSLTDQKRWADLTNSLIRQGHDRSIAGDAAAKTIFPDFNSMVYASEADTIEMLLQQVADR